ncbi:hypothetical protein EIP91_008333 [Steccherinum ochraceum]|uniref:Ribosome maturation protein SDO1/SBDS N-terminal domain-containing protein n=1 Tax=Steccherinum ochraceum TaxID=92696 RepID=A0A4R0RKK8_9APHY|nr:hypothetical protein EIP91_008333 [Steccherinum ochraceum]
MPPSRKSLTKVVYKPDSQSTDEFTVIVNSEEFKKWKEGAFEIFFSNQGAQGLLGKASNQQLDAIFGTHKDTDVITQLLQKGTAQHSDSLDTRSGQAATNLTKGSFSVDTRGGKNSSGLQ